METLTPFDRGDDFEYEFTLEDGLTSSDIAAAWFTIRTDIPPAATTSDVDALAQVTLAEGGISWLSETKGKVTISRELTNWEPDTYYCDLQFLLTSGKLKTAAPGVMGLKVRGDVTRASS